MLAAEVLAAVELVAEMLAAEVLAAAELVASGDDTCDRVLAHVPPSHSN